MNVNKAIVKKPAQSLIHGITSSPERKTIR